MSDFIQQEPNDGEPATEQTDAWVLFDRENVYIAARCWDSHPERMVANEMRRDNSNIFRNENFTVVLDTFYDRRNGYAFQTNPLGALRDSQVSNDGANRNTDWNTVWNIKTSRFEQGWIIEIAIPFKSLRYRDTPSQIWGINLRRLVRWKNETSFLSPVPRAFGTLGIYKFSSAATLVGIEPPAQSRNLELKPYAISSVLTDLEAEPVVSNDVIADAGFDLKYGLTKSLTADFTFNTDFAQVEEDEQRVNLTRFGLFFPEKREFFLESQGIFAFAGVQLRGGGSFRPGRDNPNLTPIMFFSRRIGILDEEAVPIRLGARVTGRAGKYRLGALNIQTGESQITDADPTNFSVLRLRRDILSRSDVGVIATYRTPAVEGGGSNGLLGADANLAFFDNLRINAYYARSNTSDIPASGDDEASYFGKFDYNGDRYGLVLEHLFVGQAFNPEVGFLLREAFRRSFAQVRFSPRPQSIAAVRKFSWEADFDYITNPDGSTVETRRLTGRFRIEFQNSDQFLAEYNRRFESLDEEFEISDEVSLPIGEYDFQDARIIFQFGPQRTVPGSISYRQGSFFSGDRKELVFNGRIEVSKNFNLEPVLSLNWIDLPEGDFTTRLLTTRLTYAWTPRVFLSSLIQYNSSNHSVGASVRFRWEYQPGSDLFVVYTEGRDTAVPRFPLLNNRTFVIKFTRLFRF